MRSPLASLRPLARTAFASTSTSTSPAASVAARRSFGFASGHVDDGSTPAFHGSLVPIVVEQTVSMRCIMDRKRGPGHWDVTIWGPHAIASATEVFMCDPQGRLVVLAADPAAIEFEAQAD